MRAGGGRRGGRFSTAGVGRVGGGERCGEQEHYGERSLQSCLTPPPPVAPNLREYSLIRSSSCFFILHPSSFRLPLSRFSLPFAAFVFQNFKVPRKNALMIRDFGAILIDTGNTIDANFRSLTSPTSQLPTRPAPGPPLPISLSPCPLVRIGSLVYFWGSAFPWHPPARAGCVFCRLPTGVAGVAARVATWVAPCAPPPEGIFPVKQGPAGPG